MNNDADTSIKVSKATRARLGTLAEERGTTIRNLVEELTHLTATQEELKARGEAARTYLREQMGVEVDADAEAAGQRLLDRIAARTEGPAGAAA